MSNWDEQNWWLICSNWQLKSYPVCWTRKFQVCKAKMFIWEHWYNIYICVCVCVCEVLIGKDYIPQAILSKHNRKLWLQEYNLMKFLSIQFEWLVLLNIPWSKCIRFFSVKLVFIIIAPFQVLVVVRLWKFMVNYSCWGKLDIFHQLTTSSTGEGRNQGFICNQSPSWHIHYIRELQLAPKETNIDHCLLSVSIVTVFLAIMVV